MTEKKQPEALRRASLLKLSGVLPGSVAMEVADDAIRLHAEFETLRSGYAAARLEIESLRMRVGDVPAGEYPALPKHLVAIDQNDDGYWGELQEHAWDSDYSLKLNDPLFTADQMRAYVDADRAMRAAQPAGAQQPGTAFAALPDASVGPTPEQIMAAAKVIQSHDVPDDEPKWDELPDWQIKVWLEGAEKALKAALSVTAAAAQQAPAQAAPDVSGYVSEWSGGICTADEAMAGIAKLYGAQAAPAAVAGPSISQVTEQMRAAGDHAWMTSDGVDSARVYWAMLAAAPTQPAPQQEAQEPVAWYVTGCGRLLDEYEAEAEARRIGGTAKAMPLYTVPQPSPASQGNELDAARLDWLLWMLPGDALRRVVGELSDTSDAAEFRAAIDAARKEKS